ncbi:hypothetical protein [Nesterenkonia sp. HG001]|uniref:hypothetical protein n=1 Tax=Nesterenkonia sp. HG001 TaxID=2983207 RepID=UPI002AC7B33A|nr:hypothetical protein [Nesterenkonia sp. HG001]MDZ5076989.1 hypothetical protein [Nesterenkonia sp. HG001]
MTAGAAASESETTTFEGRTDITATDDVDGRGPVAVEEPLPDVVDALLDQQRALLRELQWTYQQLDTFNRNETQRVLKNLASKIASSPAVSTETVEKAEDSLRKEVRQVGNYAQRVPSGFPKRFQQLERRLDGVEKRLSSMEQRLEALEDPLTKLSSTMTRIDRSVARLSRAQDQQGTVQRRVKTVVRNTVPSPVVRRIRQVISRAGADR